MRCEAAMVKKIKKKKDILYQCEACSFLYQEKDWAEKCEEWCNTYKSCNIEITQHAFVK